MRLLVVSNLFPPDRGGGASVFGDLCVGLTELGWNVTVLTTYPYYPEWRLKTSAKPLEIQEEEIHGVRVLRHGAFIPSSPSRLIPRILFEASFMVSIMRSLLRGGRFDAVMVFCPVLGAVCFGALRKFLFSERVWLNIQDLPAEAAAASGISRNRTLTNVAKAAQNWLFNRADVWSSISTVMIESLLKIRTQNQPVYLCRNWLNDSMAREVNEVGAKLTRPPSNPIKLLYAGNIGKKQGLLEFCKHLSQESISFHLQINGNGGEATSVENWIKQQQDPRFSFGEFLDEKGFVKALSEADIFVITERQGSGASFIPSKLIPCISTGTPIIGICDKAGPLGREVTENHLGKIIEWDEIKCISEILNCLCTNPDILFSYQSRCLQHSANYRRECAIPKLDALLRGMATADRAK